MLAEKLPFGVEASRADVPGVEMIPDFLDGAALRYGDGCVLPQLAAYRLHFRLASIVELGE